MLPKDKIIADIAAKHKLRLDEDDPILVTLSLNEVILEHATSQIEDLLTKNQADIQTAQKKHINALQAHSETLVNKASDYLSETLNDACDAKLVAMNACVTRAELLYKRITWLAITSVCLIASAMVVTLLGML